jgi:arylsulfatase A-like enzyme
MFIGIILIAAAGILVFSFAARSSTGQCRRCNVILISIDSLRADHLGIYGYSRSTSPNIDAFAKNSLLFNNFYSTAYLTPISEGSVQTGLHPEANGLISFRTEFAPNIKTLAETFKKNGYRTGSINNSPEFFTFESLRRSFSRGYELYSSDEIRMQHLRAPRWREIEHFLSAGSAQPFYLWITLGVVHAPFGVGVPNTFAQENYDGPFKDLHFYTNMQFFFDGWIYDIFAPGKEFRVFGWSPGESKLMDVKSGFSKSRHWPMRATDADLQYVVDQYDNGVAQADREFGKLMKMLERHGLTENTVVVLESEHGETLGEHGYIAHYDVWEETTHVPLIIRSPALKKANRSGLLASGVDVYPSLVQHLDLKGPDYAMDGVSLFDSTRPDAVYLTRTPLWESVLKTEKSGSIFDRFRALDDQIAFKDHAIRTRTAKLIHRTARLAEEQFSCWTFVSGRKIIRPEWEFYDLIRDPGERQPLAPDSAEAMELKAKLIAFEENMKKRTTSTPRSASVQDYQ